MKNRYITQTCRYFINVGYKFCCMLVSLSKARPNNFTGAMWKSLFHLRGNFNVYAFQSTMFPIIMNPRWNVIALIVVQGE